MNMPKKRGLVDISGVALMGLLAVVLVFSAGAHKKKGKRPKAAKMNSMTYNKLGDTGLKVSAIGVGAAMTTDPAVIAYALDNGINYFDTAESYGRGKSETAIGAVAAERRDEMVICTKLVMDGQTTREDVFRRFAASLERLQTDYADILMIHGGNRDAVENPEIHAAFAKLKEEGKIRFTGVSHHGPNLTAELRPIVEGRKVDVILCAYDPVEYPDLPELLETAEKKGMGIIAMKVFTSARKANLEEFTSGAYPFSMSALRWALRDEYVDSSIISINLMDQIDEYLKAVRSKKG